MEIEEIRRLVDRRPWRPVDFRLEDGQSFAVQHPEFIVIWDDWIVIREEEGPVFFEPEDVTAVRARHAGRRRKTGA